MAQVKQNHSYQEGLAKQKEQLKNSKPKEIKPALATFIFRAAFGTPSKMVSLKAQIEQLISKELNGEPEYVALTVSKEREVEALEPETITLTQDGVDFTFPVAAMPREPETITLTQYGVDFTFPVAAMPREPVNVDS
jgi:hypothetical protein